jgi:hypothetical protein
LLNLPAGLGLDPLPGGDLSGELTDDEKARVNEWAQRMEAEAAAAKQNVAETLGAKMKSSTDDLVRVAGYERNYGNNLAFIGRDENGKLWTVKEELLADTLGRAADETGLGHDRRSGMDLHDLVRCDSPEADPLFREMSVGALVELWSITSNDDDDSALAMQHAAEVEFGLKGTEGWPGEEETRQDRYAEAGDVYRDFLRTQYDETQATLREQNVSEITLWRGFAWMDEENGAYEPPEWARAPGEADLPTRPLSSWTANRRTADVFADPDGEYGTTVVRETFPVARVLSFPLTGIGALREAEFVVLGGTDKVDVERAGGW